jgi:hypothetical protein
VGDDSHFVFRQKLLLLLVSCQDPGHEFGCDTVHAKFGCDTVHAKFGCDTVHAKFFRQNPSACPITNFHKIFLSPCRNKLILSHVRKIDSSVRLAQWHVVLDPEVSNLSTG